MKNLSLVVVLAASVSLLTGCDPKGAFIGIYQANGSRVISGANVPAQTSQISETFEIRDGQDDEVLFPLSPGDGFSCFVPLRVQGDVASLRGSSSCTIKDSSGATGNVTFTAATAALAGSAISLSYSATLLATYGGESVSVLVQGTLTLTSLGK